MYILSFDVASKSLAVSILTFNENWQTDTNNIKEDFDDAYVDTNKPVELCKLVLNYINSIESVLDTMIQPVMLDVVDLIPTKKMKDSTVIERSERLSGYLSSLDIYIQNLYTNLRKKDGVLYHTPMNIKVLLEYQMGPNDKSRNVGSQILYHYSNSDVKFMNTNLDISKIVNNTVKSKLKNKVEKPMINYTTEIIGPSLKNKINLSDKTYKHFIEKYAKTYDANKKHSIANFEYWLKSKNANHLAKNIKKKNIDDIADSVTMALAWIHLKSGFIIQ